MSFMPGTMLVFGRGYADYNWWLSLGQQKVFFVSRLKDKADYEVMEERTVPEKGNLLKDEVIVWFKLAAEGKDCFLRRLEVWIKEQQETMVFVTNNLQLAASTIAAIYKERWRPPSEIFSCSVECVDVFQTRALTVRHSSLRTVGASRRRFLGPLSWCSMDQGFSAV
jgi:hypothetical protein